MARIKKPGVGNRCAVLAFCACRIPERHVIAAEYRHIGTVVPVPPVKGCFFDSLFQKEYPHAIVMHAEKTILIKAGMQLLSTFKYTGAQKVQPDT